MSTSGDPGYVTAGDRVTMRCGPYKGESGFISDEPVILPTVPAVIVWLFERDLRIVTVKAHFRNYGAEGGHRTGKRKQGAA